MHHLSKHLVVSTGKVKGKKLIINELLNIAQIYEKNEEVIARIFDILERSAIFTSFENAQYENLSEILFPEKKIDFDGYLLYVAFGDGTFAGVYDWNEKPNCIWTYYLDIVAEKFNADLEFTEIPRNETFEPYRETRERHMLKLIDKRNLDFHLNYYSDKSDLQSYHYEYLCFYAPVPNPFPIIELIFFLPLDKDCWMWLLITIAVSTFLWRFSEGHWNFPFGAFSYLMGQVFSRVIFSQYLNVLIHSTKFHSISDKLN